MGPHHLLFFDQFSGKMQSSIRNCKKSFNPACYLNHWYVKNDNAFMLLQRSPVCWPVEPIRRCISANLFITEMLLRKESFFREQAAAHSSSPSFSLLWVPREDQVIGQLHRTFHTETQTGLVQPHLANPSRHMQMFLINTQESALFTSCFKK